MKWYIGFLLFFLTANNGMSLLKKIYCKDDNLKQLKPKWSLDEYNQGTLALYKFGINLSKINVTLLSFNEELIGEIRIDKVKGDSDEIIYLLSKLILFAREKNFEAIGYHDYSNEWANFPLRLALDTNGFTKRLIRSNLGNKVYSDKPVEHYFYEKIL